jgi:hypothetical protein
MHRQEKDESRLREVEIAVLAYLKKHPEAADTLDGIVSWWLPQQRYETDRERIERVLSELVTHGKLRCEHLPGGAVLYALNRPGSPLLH